MPRKVTKVTDRFSAVSEDGRRYEVAEVTESYVSQSLNGRTESLLYKTYRLEDGRNVVKESATAFVVQADGTRLRRVKATKSGAARQ